MPPSSLIAVDVGNSRLKFGLFGDGNGENGLPVPTAVFEPAAATFNPSSLQEWLATAGARVEALRWWIASVNRGPTQMLTAWLSAKGIDESKAVAHTKAQVPSYSLLQHSDLPLAISLPQPDRVGIDRLVGAVAANKLRAPDQAAIIVGVGSAITVDLVSPEGALVGGAILPGIGMSARAMHEFTDQLPLLAYEALAEPPPVLGTTTAGAMQSGLYWGAVGAMKELIARLGATCGPGATATSDRRTGKSVVHDVFLTGGAAPTVAGFLDPLATYIPHLRLAGIALVAQQ
jgi:type III pantothenate kinase